MKVLIKEKPPKFGELAEQKPTLIGLLRHLPKSNCYGRIIKDFRLWFPVFFYLEQETTTNWGYSIYAIAYIGDIIDLTNERIISPNKFKKDYSVIEGD
ncbi:role in replication [Streptococcus criceti]|uniref:Uncharacterized protein n=1 Tax=Streptococcus criceti HS-6 TaxID=873449 RepID=G5JTL0_STRCG|nr:hypothetical protein [Streptococcus criceti]EHI74854.1 hypothetical protein STRCR_1107 [Streptococcus criceti HS-6]SUN37682.1 role in replication [Streptococcus criceti]